MNWKDIFPKENKYFETNNGLLYHSDSLKLLKNIPDESIDLVITDPPYFMGKKPFRNKEKNYERVVEEWDNQWENIDGYIKWCEKWIDECIRVMKPGASILVFGSFHNAMHLKVLLDKKLKFRNFITVYSPNAMPIKFAKKIGIYAYSCEYILYYSNGKVKYFDYEYLKRINGGKQHRDLFIDYGPKNNERTGHPTQKSLELISKLVITHSPEGSIILDPFFGSGTSGAVCEKNNRKWIGIEKEIKYCKIIKERIKKITSQKLLFEVIK